MGEEEKKVIDSFMDKISPLRGRISGLYLFGSRARGTARLDSDYDFLFIVPKKEHQLKSKLYDAAIEIQMDSDADISLKIIEKLDFDRMVSLKAPFTNNILKEGIKLG